MRRLFGVVVPLVLAAACSNTPPAACTGDTSCDGGRCIAGGCYEKTCGTTTCALAQVCVSNACTDETCVNKTCDLGSACLKGDCLSTSCGTTPCANNQVCDPKLNLCIDALCYGVVCPTGQTCAAGACTGGGACGSMTCDSMQACVNQQCVATCGTNTCAVGQVCDTGTTTCVAPDCTGVVCDAGTCVNGSCSDTACAGVVCDGGTCMNGTCVDTACMGVVCDGGVCQNGVCHSACDFSCASPCPTCANGHSCAATLDCLSRDCDSNVCTMCSGTSTCPNGGMCMNGICRSGLNGPCASTLDCEPGNLVCDTGECRLPANAACASDMQCIQSLRCENFVCQRPHCLFQLLEVQSVPSTTNSYEANGGFGLQANGEIYMTSGQWGTTSGNFIRRYRVVPGGDAGVTEQDPTMPPLISAPTQILAQGHSDTPGTATISENVAVPKQFSWLPGGGAFDGRVAVTVEFSGFNADAFPNLDNIGRFAKCGQNFYFAMQSSMTASGRVLLLFQFPNAIGSGTTAQDLSTSAARRDDNVFTDFFDLACTADTLFVIGLQDGVAQMQALDPNTLALRGSPWMLPALDVETSTGDFNIAVVDDTYSYILGSRGEAYQFWDGGAVSLGAGTFGTIVSGTASYNANATEAVVTTSDNHIYRYARRLMDGTTPPPNLDCQWQ